MSLVLPAPAKSYDAGNEAQARAALEREDIANMKKTQDVDIGMKRRLVLTAPNGTRWSVTVSNSGTLSAVAI
jgi:hypothetical protein